MKERGALIANGAPHKRDFLSRCFEAREKYPDLVTERLIMLYNFDNVGAGSDTTAISLTAVGLIHSLGNNRTNIPQIFYFLMKTPACMQKAIEEIDNADREGQLSEFITWKESNRLPYLQACIKEAIRESIRFRRLE